MAQYDYAPTVRLADLAARQRLRDTAATVPRRIRVLLNVVGGRVMRGHTVDIGVERLSVSLPASLEPGQECAVFFGLTIEDQIYSVVGTARVLACVATGAGNFRAEMHFNADDKKSRIALEQLFGRKQSVCVQ